MSDFDDAIEKARSDAREFPTEHRFEMVGECKDKSGDLTRVLIIDTDRPGILGKIMDLGNPMAVSPTEGIVENDRKISEYLRFMANIDMSRSENQKAIGIDAIIQGRNVVRDFFVLRLVSSLPLARATAS